MVYLLVQGAVNTSCKSEVTMLKILSTSYSCFSKASLSALFSRIIYYDSTELHFSYSEIAIYGSILDLWVANGNYTLHAYNIKFRTEQTTFLKLVADCFPL